MGLSLRRRIAAAYQRSGWARLGIVAVVLLVFWAGMLGLLFTASLAMQPILFVVWLLLVGMAAAWVVVP